MSANVGSEGTDPNLTPLLDLVLQLIMFFMITVNFVRVDQFDDSIKLPVATSAVAIDSSAEDWVFLNLGADGQLKGVLSNQMLDTPQKIKVFLMTEKANLERSAKARGKTGDIKIVVILRADKNCKYGDVWKVLDSCQQAGFRYWQLRAMTRAASLRLPPRDWFAWDAPPPWRKMPIIRGEPCARQQPRGAPALILA
jgi:biopolymer transport protein ExbD